MEKEKCLGVEVSPYNMDEVLLQINHTITENKKAFVVAINPEKVIKCQKDEKLKSLINSADIKIPDGTGVVIASKLRGGKVRSRVTGIDLMKNICRVSGEMGHKVFLLGGKPNVAERAAKSLKDEIKNLDIVGIQDGYFKDDKKIIDDINASKANIVFIALGSPKQENWISSNMKNINANIFMGVGGSFDVICGDINRAPVFMQNMGLEWAYRLFKDPKRITRLGALPKFIFKSLCYKEK